METTGALILSDLIEKLIRKSELIDDEIDTFQTEVKGWVEQYINEEDQKLVNLFINSPHSALLDKSVYELINWSDGVQ